VRSVETARTEESDGHARPSANESREGLSVGGNEITTSSSFALQGWIVEVEDEILWVIEDGKAINCSICERELRSDRETWCRGASFSWGSEDGGGQDGRDDG